MVQHQCIHKQGQSSECRDCPIFTGGFCDQFVRILKSTPPLIKGIPFEDRQDILAEAAASIIGSVNKSHIQTKARFYGWAKRIYANKIADYLREKYTRQRQKTILESIRPEALEENIQINSMADTDMISQIKNLYAHEQISEREKRALDFFFDYYEAIKAAGAEASVKEVARMMGVEPNTLTVYMKRYRAVVRELMEHHGIL